MFVFFKMNELKCVSVIRAGLKNSLLLWDDAFGSLSSSSTDTHWYIAQFKLDGTSITSKLL